MSEEAEIVIPESQQELLKQKLRYESMLAIYTLAAVLTPLACLCLSARFALIALCCGTIPLFFLGFIQLVRLMRCDVQRQLRASFKPEDLADPSVALAEEISELAQFSMKILKPITKHGMQSAALFAIALILDEYSMLGSLVLGCAFVLSFFVTEFMMIMIASLVRGLYLEHRQKRRFPDGA